MNRIPISEVSFHPWSFIDQNGRVFWWRGQLYRGITKERAILFRALFENGVIQDLVGKGLLVQTELTNLTLDGYDEVLQHRRLPFVSFVYEWCYEMIKDAALLVLDLQIELQRHNLTLQDAHPYNIVFDGCRPIWVDFGSIVDAQGHTSWHAHDEFLRNYIYPLEFIARGFGRIARWLLHDPERGVLLSDLGVFEQLTTKGKMLSSVQESIPSVLRPIAKASVSFVRSRLSKLRLPNHQSTIDILKHERERVEAIIVPTKKTEWSQYTEGSWQPFLPCESWDDKSKNVHKILSEVRPSSVLDIGSTLRWSSQLAATTGSKVVAFNLDENCISNLYQVAKQENLDILPLVMDILQPSPGYGLCDEWHATARQRLRCDMVLALALIHHLVFKKWLTFQHVVKGLSSFSKQWVLVEFVPREDTDVIEWWSERYSWYTLEKFIESLRLEFHSVRIYPSNSARRVLLLCEK